MFGVQLIKLQQINVGQNRFIDLNKLELVAIN